MEVLNAAQFFCPRCSAEVAANVAICPHCGAALSASSEPSRQVVPTEPRQDLLDNPWMVLGLLFLATGVLGLPFLWRSKGFSPASKVVIGVVVTLYTLMLAALATWAVLRAWRVAQDAFDFGVTHWGPALPTLIIPV